MAGTKLPLLAEMAEVLTPIFASAGVADSGGWAENATRQLCAHFGGSSLYFPRDSAAQRERRDAEIRRRHDGTRESVVHLAREFGLTEIYIYRLLARRPPRG